MNKEYYIGFYSDTVKRDVKNIVRQFNLGREFDIATDNLKRNPQCGNKIPPARWPSKYKHYGISNLWRYELSNRRPGWRLIYTIMPQGRVKILTAILDVLNHHRYDRMFGYG